MRHAYFFAGPVISALEAHQSYVLDAVLVVPEVLYAKKAGTEGRALVDNGQSQPQSNFLQLLYRP